MDWQATYWQLSHDRESVPAWSDLERRVRRWARSALRALAWDVIEDVVADTCAAVAIDFDRSRGPDTFAGFVYGHFLTVRRRALRHQRRFTMASLMDVDVAAPEEDTDGPTAEQVACLHRALELLPVRERRAVSLRYLESASAAQIAVALGVSEINARQLVYRGLRHLHTSIRATRQAASAATPVSAYALAEAS